MVDQRLSQSVASWAQVWHFPPAPRSLAFALSLMADLTVSEILPPGFWQDQEYTPSVVTGSR